MVLYRSSLLATATLPIYQQTGISVVHATADALFIETQYLLQALVVHGSVRCCGNCSRQFAQAAYACSADC